MVFTGSFEESIKKLDEIVKKMEKGDAPLDEMLKLYEEGTALSKHCQKILKEAEGKINILIKTQQGEIESESFDMQK